MKERAYKIGLTYRLAIDGTLFDVTLIRTEGEHARVLVQNHSINMSLSGFTTRKKMYSQAVPVRIVPLTDLQHIDERKTQRGLNDWLHSKIRL